MDLLTSFRDDNDLNMRQLDNISDAVLLVSRCSWAERTITTRWDESVYVSLLWVSFGEIGTHPNVVLLQFLRFRGWFVMKNNETCNALKCLKSSGLIDWKNCRLCNRRVLIKAPICQERRPGASPSLNVVGTLHWTQSPSVRMITLDQTTFLIQALFTWKEFLKHHGFP